MHGRSTGSTKGAFFRIWPFVRDDEAVFVVRQPSCSSNNRSLSSESAARPERMVPADLCCLGQGATAFLNIRKMVRYASAPAVVMGPLVRSTQ